MALLQPGDLFPNGTASISFTSGSGITITPFSQSGDAYVVFETDLINYPNTTQYLEGATFTEKTNSLGDVVDGSGYRAGIFTYPGSSFVFTPSVDIPEGRVLIKSTGNIGLDVSNGLLNLYPGAAAAYSLRQLDLDYTGSAIEVRRASDNASASFGFDVNGDLDTGSLLTWTSNLDQYLLDYASGSTAAYSLRRLSTDYTGSAIEVRRSSDNTSSSFGFDSNGDLDTGSLLSFVNTEITDDINTTTDSNSDGLADGLSKLTGNPTTTIVTGNGHIGSAQRMEYNVGAGTLQGIGINTLSTMIGQEITISFMYRSNISFFLGNGNDTAGGGFDNIPANTGNAIRYEHKGVWSPTGGSDGRLQPMWLDASGEFIEISDWSVTYHTADGHVKTWYDQSGNNNHATQTTNNNQPKIVNTGSLVTENGKAAIDFDGSDDFLQNTSFAVNLSSGLSVFFVDKENSLPANNGTFNIGTVATNGVSAFYNNNPIYNPFTIVIKSSVNRFTPTGSVSRNTNQNLYGFDFDGVNESLTSSYGFAINGSGIAAVTAGPVAALTSNDFRIGRAGGSFVGEYFTGKKQEMIIFNSDQSSKRLGIETNINSYYNIYTNPSESAFVKTWYDQSGNTNDATQTTNDNQPMIVNTGSLVVENGKAAIDFDGVNDNFDISNFTSVPTISQFNVLKPSATNVDETFTSIQNATTTDGIFLGQGNLGTEAKFGLRNYQGVDVADSGIAITLQQYLVAAITTSTTAQIYANGVAGAISAKARGNVGGDTQIGANGASGNSFSGKFQEIIIFASNQSANRTGIENNINNFYSIYSP